VASQRPDHRFDVQIDDQSRPLVGRSLEAVDRSVDIAQPCQDPSEIGECGRAELLTLAKLFGNRSRAIGLSEQRQRKRRL